MYELKLHSQYRIHAVFHVSLLKPHFPPVSVPSTEPGPIDKPPPLCQIINHPIYTVKKTMDSQCCGGQLEYLVDWEDYGPEGGSWVPRDDILDPVLSYEIPSTTSTLSSSSFLW